MPYMTQHFQPLDLAQVSPFGYGLSQLGQGINRGSELYNQILNSQLNKFAIEQKKAEEPYYGDIAKANALQAQLMPEHLKAQIGLLNTQQNEINTLLPYNTKTKQMELQKQQLMQDYIKKIMGGNNIQPQNNSALSSGANTNLSNNGMSLVSANAPTSNTQGSNDQSGSGYANAALISQYLGLPKPELKEIPGTGRIDAITQFGNYPVAQGLSAEEEARAKGFGKEDAKQYGELTEGLKGYQNQNVALDQMIKLSNDPEFMNVTGPVQSFLTKWSGTPEQQQLLGQLQSSSGEITLQIAPSLKGAFTGKDQTLLNGIKANPKTDFPDVFIGKLKAQKLVNNILEKRQELSAGYIRAGMPADKAIKKATDQTPIARYEKQINDLVHPAGQMIKIRNPKTGEQKIVSLEDAKRKYGIRI